MKKKKGFMLALTLGMLVAVLIGPASAGAGVPISSRFVIRNHGSATEIESSVAYNSQRGEYLVVWHNEWAANTSSDDEITPAVAAISTEPNHGQYMVAWERETGLTRDVQARPVAGDETLGPIVVLADSPWSEHSPALAGCEGQRQFLATWVWIPVITPPARMEVQARTLALDGVYLDEMANVGGGQVFQSAVSATSGCGFLVVFDDNEVFSISNRGIYGRVWGSRFYLPLVVRSFP